MINQNLCSLLSAHIVLLHCSCQSQVKIRNLFINLEFNSSEFPIDLQSKAIFKPEQFSNSIFSKFFNTEKFHYLKQKEQILYLTEKNKIVKVFCFIIQQTGR